jgi:hypothetical protein
MSDMRLRSSKLMRRSFLTVILPLLRSVGEQVWVNGVMMHVGKLRGKLG